MPEPEASLATASRVILGLYQGYNANACLLVDERLPGITGLDALNQLRNRDVKLPAILMTSHPSASVRATAKAAGVPILEKPLLGDALTVAIRNALFG